MTKWKDKNNYKFWHTPIALALFFIFLVFFAYNIIGLVETERETSKKKEMVLDEIEDLKEREVSLLGDISKIETEEGKEEIIREKYQVAKEGEKMVVIVNEKKNVDNEVEEKDSHGFWNWVKGIFEK